MSKPIQDKKKSNFIIACGYCLVVFVILVNYLAKAPYRREGYREGTRPSNPNIVYDKNNNSNNGDLASQLKETKRMNREMREMLIDIQNAKNSQGPSRVPHRTAESAQASREMPKPVPVIDMNSMTLPELNSKIDEKFKKDTSCPYIIGRNPFASPVVVTDISTTEEPITFPGHTVISNPKLPYVFSGNNSNLRIISNY